MAWANPALAVSNTLESTTFAIPTGVHGKGVPGRPGTLEWDAER
jgi:hypothetical protein